MRFNVRFNQQDMQLCARFDRLETVTEFANADPYTGSYEVTPKVNAQTLPTAQKLMVDDVKVHAIPIFEVSNNDGGETIYIATEVDIYGD